MAAGTTFYDEHPIKYVRELYDAAKAFMDTKTKRIQEQWDMFMAYDEYIEDRRTKGRSALSFPIIFAHIEARVATLIEILSTNENFLKFEPRMTRNPFMKIAAERLESGFANIRADLDWDSLITEHFLANEVFDHNWIGFESKTIQIQPETGLRAKPELIGTEKTYPGFELYAPNNVLVDGNWERQYNIPARFKRRFRSYTELRAQLGDKIEPWMIERMTSKGDAISDGLLSPADWSRRAGPSAADRNTAYDDRNSGGHNVQTEKGFVLVEAHYLAIYKSGDVESRIMAFLPGLTEGPGRGEFRHGYPLFDIPKPFHGLSWMLFMTRGRPLPYTPEGKGTSDLLVPFQRDFSEQVSTERDLDRLYQAPPIAMRTGLYAGQEEPTMDAYKIWPFEDEPDTYGIPLDHFAKPIVVPTPNRGYAGDTNQKLQNLMNLISAAVEAETGGVDVNPNKTATAFSGRARAANRRIMVPFRQQAATIQNIMRGILVMMGEAPSQFLYPEIAANSNLASMYGGAGEGVLLPSDVQSAVHVRVPSLAQYANREMQKVMWRMVAEGLMQLPIMQGSPAGQIMLAEDLLRSMEIGEARVSEYAATIQQDLMMQMAMAQSAPIEAGGGPQPGQIAPPAGRMGPGTVTKAANLTAQGVG
jgi:hypothetical protein